MKIGDQKDLVSGLVIGAFALFVIYEASGLPYVSEFGPGPGFLPFWLGTGLISVATLLVANAILNPESFEHGSLNMMRPFAGWVGFALAIALLDRLGFILSFALLTLFLVRVMERRSLRTGLSVAASVALVFYLIFVVSLGVPLPLGPLGF